MYLLFLIILILAGVIAASGAIIAKSPNAKETLDKLAPFHGIIGIALLVIGVIYLLDILPNIGSMFSAGLWGILLVVAVFVGLLLGFMLGLGTIQSFMNKDKEPAAADAGPNKADQFQAKLNAVRTPLGFAALILGVIFLVRHFM